jgi:hypothetical protein
MMARGALSAVGKSKLMRPGFKGDLMKHTSVDNRWRIGSRKTRILIPTLYLSLVISACMVTPGAIPAATTPAGGSSTADPRTAVLHAIQAHLTAGPYRVVASTTAGASEIAIHGEVILPDRFHLFSSNSGRPEREYIIIGPATYAKVDGQWTQIQVDLSGLLANFIDRLNPDVISDVRLVGPENADGVPALAYTYTYTNTIDGTLITNQNKIWVGVESGLPLKQVVDGEISGTAYHSEQVIEYDSSITIETPVIS